MTVRIATRRSALALAQSRRVAADLARVTGQPVELVEVTTRGDTDAAPLSQIGGTGVFVTGIRQAVLEGRADVAVHSLKDLPTAAQEGIELAAVPPREDPRDVLVARGGARLGDLRAGARVGTGSPRRRAQVLAARPDLQVVDIRGNVDSRLDRVLGPRADLDAVVLAAAGLVRLDLAERISEHLDPMVLVPAPGQGALAVEIRNVPADADLASAVRTLDDPSTRVAVDAERALLAALGVGCSAPVGALGTVPSGGQLSTVHLLGVVARIDGSLVRMSTTGPADRAAQVGRSLAADLLARLEPAPAQERGSNA